MVPWSAGSGSPASAPASYNLRHIRSDASDKSDDAWLVTTVTAVPGSADTIHWLQDLESNIPYDLQVQAANGAGTSPWSATATGTTGEAIRVRWITCTPGRPLPGREVSCTASLGGGVRSDDSFAWLAEDGTPGTGDLPTFRTSWDTHGSKRVTVEVCSAGACDGMARNLRVEDLVPILIWDHRKPPAEIGLGDSIDLEFEITKLSRTGAPGGITVSFPTLTGQDLNTDSSSYDSRQGSVETVSYSGRDDRVVYYDSGSGSTLEMLDGSTGRTQHLAVATDNASWPRSWFYAPSGRTLSLKVTPKLEGEFRILYRMWLCDTARVHCGRRPVQDGPNAAAIDQQGWAAFEYSVNVVGLPVIDSVVCTPSPAPVGAAVTCTPRLSGGAPSTYAWNAGNALAGGSPFEGTDPRFATSWSYAGQQTVTLEVCNVAGCDTGQQTVTVGGAITTDTGLAPHLTEEGLIDSSDGGRILYSGPVTAKAASGYSATDPTLHVKVLPTTPMPTLQVTIVDENGFGADAGAHTSPGVLALALPKEAWIDYSSLTTELFISGAWTPYTQQTESTLLSLERILSAVHRTSSTVSGITPAANDAALSAADRLAWALDQPAGLPLDDIFGERHANCVSQVSVPWLGWASQTRGVRVSIPLSVPADSHISLATAFTADESGAAEPVLAQLHDLLDTGNDAPICQPPQLATP